MKVKKGDFMRDTFLFDLDGTVLPMDFDKFMELYFYNIGEHFKEIINPKELVRNILESTEIMVKTKNDKSNEEIFMTHFDTLIDGDVENYKPMFYDFYNSTFDKVKASTHKSKYMRKSIDLLKEKGYKVVLATNPLFPMIANHHRIRWAGFEPSEFEYISTRESISTQLYWMLFSPIRTLKRVFLEYSCNLCLNNFLVLKVVISIKFEIKLDHL